MNVPLFPMQPRWGKPLRTGPLAETLTTLPLALISLIPRTTLSFIKSPQARAKRRDSLALREPRPQRCVCLPPGDYSLRRGAITSASEYLRILEPAPRTTFPQLCSNTPLGSNTWTGDGTYQTLPSPPTPAHPTPPRQLGPRTAGLPPLQVALLSILYPVRILLL